MARYILNSAVITTFGRWTYIQLTPEQAGNWLEADEFESTIRYQETALALEYLTGVHIPVNAFTCQMRQSDEALVFRLVLPPGSPRIATSDKGKLSVEFISKNCEIGLLKCVGKPPRITKRGQLRGEAHGRAKLTKKQIKEAYDLHYKESRTMKFLEKKYGVDRTTLYKAWKGVSWHED